MAPTSAGDGEFRATSITGVLTATAGSGPLCPLPGTVLAVLVEVGQIVDDGTALMVVEAMKMEHTITATTPAIVEEIRFDDDGKITPAAAELAPPPPKTAEPDPAPKRGLHRFARILKFRE